MTGSKGSISCWQRNVRCAACGFDNPPGMRFCGQCAAPIALSEGAGKARKIVTILFADVVGSTRLATSLDPEQLQAKMARFFQIAHEEIQRYGGTVEKFIGDAVMAVFGVPTVHEDDAVTRIRMPMAALAARSSPSRNLRG